MAAKDGEQVRMLTVEGYVAIELLSRSRGEPYLKLGSVTRERPPGGKNVVCSVLFRVKVPATIGDTPVAVIDVDIPAGTVRLIPEVSLESLVAANGWGAEA